MRFDESDVREAYRRGARDCYESLANAMQRKQAKEIEVWLQQLEGWEDFDPPPAPLFR
jgi:hypothetical protein